jgi:hypothetical protein
MKCNLFATLSLGALSALLTVTSAYAQPGVVATVPFAFNVGTTQMPAGTYRIAVKPLDSSITIQNCNTTATVHSHGQQEYPGKKSQKLVFRQVNHQYYLTEIWGEQGSDGMMLKAPKPDTRLEVAGQPSPSGNQVMIATK